MASLVEQIYMQAKGGSAGGAGFADFLVQGRQLSQRQQQINMQESQLAAELSMVPLKKTLLQQDAQMNALKIEDDLKARQLAIDNAKTIQTAWDWAGKEVSKGNLKGAFDVAFGMAGQSIGIVEDPKFKALTSHLTKLVELANQRAEIDARMPAPNLGGVTVVTNPEDSTQKAAFVRTGPNSLTVFPKVEDPNAFQSNFGKLVDDRNKALKLGKMADVSRFDAMLAKSVAESGMSLSTNPDGTVNITKGNPQGLTVATQSRLQEQSFNNFEAINTLQDAIAGIRATPSAIGVRGKIGSMAEQARGQLQSGEPMETPITDVRQKASVAFSRVAPALRIDSGNMSKYELNKLEQAGDVLGWEEAPQTAERKLSNLMAVVVGRELRVLKTQGKPVPDEILRQIQGEEIAGLIQSGLLTKEEANRLYQLSRQNGR